jgi:hypothetical protein
VCSLRLTAPAEIRPWARCGRIRSGPAWAAHRAERLRQRLKCLCRRPKMEVYPIETSASRRHVILLKKEAEILCVSPPPRVLSITCSPALSLGMKAAPRCGATTTEQASSQDLDCYAELITTSALNGLRCNRSLRFTQCHAEIGRMPPNGRKFSAKLIGRAIFGPQKS